MYLQIVPTEPFKDVMKKQLQLQYAGEAFELLKASKLVRVDVSASAVKHRSANWIMSTWKEIQDHPDIAINGFRNTGILHTISFVLQ